MLAVLPASSHGLENFCENYANIQNMSDSMFEKFK
jgi:hypothetical protein